MSDGIFTAFRVSAQGLRAQRMRLDLIAENMANAETTRTPEGGPYRPKEMIFSAKSSGNLLAPRRKSAGSFQEILNAHSRHFSSSQEAAGSSGMQSSVLEISIEERSDAVISEYDPGHPDADEEGIVQKPNVDPVREMMNLIAATRAYEANATVLDTAKQMLNRALEI